MDFSINFQVEDFRLDKMLVVQHFQELGNSSNKPMLTRCINSDTGKKEDIVIKLNASERMSPDACMKECVASLMALTMDIWTPLPKCVIVDEPFISSRLTFQDYTRYKKSKGLNFGTNFIKGLQEFYKSYQLPDHFRIEALRIFAFDLLIQNVDRTLPPGKPNLFTEHQHLYVLDHELAFAFLDLLFSVKENPWEFGEEGLSSARSHILYLSLKHKHLDFSSLNGMLTPFSTQYWHQIGRIIPEEWKDEARLRQIEKHVTAVRSHEAEFITNIQTILK